MSRASSRSFCSSSRLYGIFHVFDSVADRSFYCYLVQLLLFLLGGSRLFLGGRFALSLLHLYAACRHGQRNDRDALGIGEHALVVFLSLLGKEGAEFSRVYAAVAALKMQRVVLVCAGQLCVKFLFAGNQGAVCLHKKIAVFGQPC